MALTGKKSYLGAAVIVMAALVLSVFPPGFASAEGDIYRAVSGAHYSAVAAPGANTDAITNITWVDGRLRLYVQVETSTVVNLMVHDGTNEIDYGLNGNSALAAGALYVFDFDHVGATWIVNIQSETDTVWDTISIGTVR